MNEVAVLKARITPTPLTFLYPTFFPPAYHRRQQLRNDHPQVRRISTTSPVSRTSGTDNKALHQKTSFDPSVFEGSISNSNSTTAKTSKPRSSRLDKLLKRNPANPPSGRSTSAELLEESYASRPQGQRPEQGAIFAHAERALNDSSPSPPNEDRFDRAPREPYRSSYRNSNTSVNNRPLSSYGQPAFPLNPATQVVRTIRSTPVLGRTIQVKQGDVGTALKNLNKLCYTERIKADRRTQKFYERPGAKRKRLRSVRHKFRFFHAFRATVRRITEMRRKGW